MGGTPGVGHTLPGLGRPSTKSPANFLRSASHFAPFLALKAVFPPPPSPTVEVTGQRGVLPGARECRSGSLGAHSPLSCQPVARAPATPGNSHRHRPQSPGSLASRGSHGEMWVRDSCMRRTPQPHITRPLWSLSWECCPPDASSSPIKTQPKCHRLQDASAIPQQRVALPFCWPLGTPSQVASHLRCLHLNLALPLGEGYCRAEGHLLLTVNSVPSLGLARSKPHWVFVE